MSMAGTAPRPEALHAWLGSALAPGGLAIIHLAVSHTEQEGEPTHALSAPHPLLGEALAQLTGRTAWVSGRAHRCAFEAIDDGMVLLLDPCHAVITPHSGVRIVQRLLTRLVELGATPTSSDRQPARRAWPQAEDEIEAFALAAIVRAASPLAVDLLLDQPRRWRRRPTLTAEDRARSARLNRLVQPPVVVLAGPPNVGKSTLTNTLAGRTLSIESDAAGTTRDYTSATIDLNGLVVQWHDAPGMRETEDPIERAAIALARGLLRRADLVIAITDAAHDWPAIERVPDLRVASRADLGRRHDLEAGDLEIVAPRGEGIETLVREVRERLVPSADLAHPGPWRFDERLPV